VFKGKYESSISIANIDDTTRVWVESVDQNIAVYSIPSVWKSTQTLTHTHLHPHTQAHTHMLKANENPCLRLKFYSIMLQNFNNKKNWIFIRAKKSQKKTCLSFEFKIIWNEAWFIRNLFVLLHKNIFNVFTDWQKKYCIFQCFLEKKNLYKVFLVVVVAVVILSLYFVSQFKKLSISYLSTINYHCKFVSPHFSPSLLLSLIPSLSFSFHQSRLNNR
jgi:hypothetical protein